jgi:hypothetical protein
VRRAGALRSRGLIWIVDDHEDDHGTDRTDLDRRLTAGQQPTRPVTATHETSGEFAKCPDIAVLNINQQ